MTAMRHFVGEVLRAQRVAQELTLRELSAQAQVSISYISEVERGHKEPSSELLAALTGALGVPLSSVMHDVADKLQREEEAALATVSTIVLGGAVQASAA
jgi:transcriptional regulator with XRE-family HTH domain